MGFVRSWEWKEMEGRWDRDVVGIGVKVGWRWGWVRNEDVGLDRGGNADRD